MPLALRFALELRQPAGGGGGVSAGRPASHPAGHQASHPASHHCFVHACLPHRPCSQDLKMMSPIHGVCGKISFPLNKAHHKWGIIDKTFKGRKLAILKQAVFVLCNIQNMSRCLHVPYMPYTPCVEE